MPGTLVIVGPSGAGKSTLARRLVASGSVRLHPTWTTRPKRPGEEVFEHVFVTDDEMRQAIGADKLYGTFQLPGLPYLYGLPRWDKTSAVDLVLLRARAVERFERAVGEAVVYHVSVPSGVAQERMQERGDGAPDVVARLEAHADEEATGRKVAHRVLDGTLTIADLVEEARRAVEGDVQRGLL